MADYFVVPNYGIVESAVDLENAIHDAEARKNAVLFGMNRCRGSHARIDARLSRGIAGGTIFEESSLQDFSDAPTVPIQCVVSGKKVGV